MLSLSRILAESDHPFQSGWNFPHRDCTIFNILFLLVLREAQTVIIKTGILEEDASQISKLQFLMENPHPSHWWNIATQENKRLTRVWKTSIYINMQRHLLQSWVTCWFKSSAGETCSRSALPAVAGATLGNRNYWRGFRWTKTFPLAKKRHTGNWNKRHTPTVFHL